MNQQTHWFHWLVIITAACCLAAFEWELSDTPFLSAKTGAMFSVAGLRLFLFYRSGQMFQEANWKGWSGFGFSAIMFVFVAVYGELLEGLSGNDRLLYHALNLGLTFAEAGLGISVIKKTDTAERLRNTEEALRKSEEYQGILLGIIEVLSGYTEEAITPIEEASARAAEDKETIELLRTEIEELKEKGKRWDLISENVGRVQKRGTRHSMIIPNGLIASCDKQGNLEGGTSTPNGKVISYNELINITNA